MKQRLWKLWGGGGQIRCIIGEIIFLEYRARKAALVNIVELGLILRRKLTNEYFSQFLVHQRDSKTFMDVEITRKPVQSVDHHEIAHVLILMRIPRIPFMR